MLLVLLNFPTSMGEVSKPNGGKGPQQGDWANTEPFVFPFWCVGPGGGKGQSIACFCPVFVRYAPKSPTLVFTTPLSVGLSSG